MWGYKWGGGGAQTYHCPHPNKKSGGGANLLLPRFLRQWYGHPYWCSRNTFASEITAPVKVLPPLAPTFYSATGNNLFGL